MDVSIFFCLLKRKFADVIETRVELIGHSLVFVVKNLNKICCKVSFFVL